MTSAQITDPPSPSKALLIERFLNASGVQFQIDSGAFLEKYAFSPSFLVGSAKAEPFAVVQALRTAYEPHRQTWQQEYERHLNWEFTETELEEIIAFLECPAGVHFLEARWRMDAYIGTNTEELLEEIIRTAVATLKV